MMRHAVTKPIPWAVLSILLVLCLSAGAPPASGESPPSHVAQAEAPSSVARGDSAPDSTVDYCGLLGPHPGTSADLPNYTQNVSVLWYELCAQPAFARVINQWGNLYLAYTGGANNSTYWASGNLTVGAILYRIPLVQFGVFFSAPCTNVTGGEGFDCTYETYWDGNVSTNRLTGPFTTEFACPGCRFTGPPPPGSAGGSRSFPAAWLLGAAAVAAAALAAAQMARRPRPVRTPQPDGRAVEEVDR